MNKQSKITVVGTGYVGMSLSVLMAQHNEVIALDIDSEKVKKINNKESTILDKDIDDRVFEDEEDEGQIALDIIETPKKIKIYAPIAGIELEEIDLTLNK